MKSIGSDLARVNEDQLANEKCQEYKGSLAAIQERIQEIQLSDSPKVEEIGKGEFEMSTEKANPKKVAQETQLDASLVDGSQTDQSMVKGKKARKNPDAGQELIDDEGNPTGFVQGYSKESFACKAVSDYLYSMKASSPTLQQVAHEVVPAINRLHGTDCYRLCEPSGAKVGSIKCIR